VLKVDSCKHGARTLNVNANVASMTNELWILSGLFMGLKKTKVSLSEDFRGT